MGRGGLSTQETENLSFTRVREDRVDVDEIFDFDGAHPKMFLLRATKANENKLAYFFVDEDAFKIGQTHEDPIDFFVKSAILRRYILLPKEISNILTTTPLEAAMNEPGFYEHLNANPQEVIEREGGLNSNNLVSIDWYDHGFYRAGQRAPITRPYRIETHIGINEEHFNLERAKDILEAHPWVLATHPYPRRYGNYGNPEGLQFDILLPQKEHDAMALYSNRGSKSKNPRPKGVSNFDLTIALTKAPLKEDLGDGHYPLGRDPLGLKPAVLETPALNTWSPDEDRY
jgi:hypothetical protein